MKIPIEDCREAFKIVDQVDTQPGLPSSMFVRLAGKNSKFQLSLTGLCVGRATVATDDPGEWSWYVDRRIFGAFLASTKAKTVSLDILGEAKDVLRLQSGRHKVSAAGMEAISGYANWTPKTVTELPLSPAMRKELVMLAEYAPTTAAADHLSAVYLVKGYGVIATDSFVVAASIDPAITHTFPLPVVLSRSLTANGTGTESLLLDKNGAGIRYNKGYLYQPQNQLCLSSYPLKKIQDVVTARLAIKPTLKVAAGVFRDALTRLRGFVFGADTDLRIHCQPGKVPGSVLLTMDLAQGKVQTSMAVASAAENFETSWLVPKITPWVEYIAGLSDEVVISCGFDEECSVFQALHQKRRRLLVVAASS